MRFLVADQAVVAVNDESPHVRSAVARAMDPYAPEAGEADTGPTIDLTVDSSLAPLFADVQRPANDAMTTLSDGEGFYLLEGERVCSIPSAASGPPFVFRYQPGFPVTRLVRPLLRPALQVGLLAHGSIAVHSSCVDVDGSAVIVAGWSETGKTETALAFAEQGARFIADKWTIVADDGTAWPFPISVGVRRWVLPHLPRLRSALPVRARVQMLVASGVAGLSHVASARARAASSRKRTFERAVALADRAGLRLSELHAIYGDRPDTDTVPRAPLRAVAVLTTVRGGRITAERADPGRVARRLSRTAAYERRPFFAVDERRRFAFPDRDARAVESIELREQERLARILENVDVIEVRAPFPSDPRPVRDAIVRCL